MNEEQQVQSEETQQTSTETTVEKEVTLDDVYRDAGLDKLAEQSEQRHEYVPQQQQQPQKVEPSSIPDAYDADNFKAFLATQAGSTQALHQAVTQMAAHLSAQQRDASLKVTQADIQSAVSTLSEAVEGVKPKALEAYLDGAVREDSRLKAIWENRAKNPTAWNNALKIVSKQAQEDFSVRLDPDLQRAQRARKESQKQMATTTNDKASNSTEDRLGKAQGQEFSIGWEQLISGGH